MTTDQAAKRRTQRPPADLVAALRGRALRCPDSLRSEALGLVSILAAVRDSGTRERRALRLHLPKDLPEPMAARVAALLERSDALMPELFELFKQYIDQATEAIRLKFTTCVRCPEPTRGKFGVPGIGWLCLEHWRELCEGGAERMGFSKPEPINKEKPWLEHSEIY